MREQNSKIVVSAIERNFEKIAFLISIFCFFNEQFKKSFALLILSDPKSQNQRIDHFARTMPYQYRSKIISHLAIQKIFEKCSRPR